MTLFILCMGLWKALIKYMLFFEMQCNQYDFAFNLPLILITMNLINSWFNIPITQTTIFFLFFFASVRVLFQGAKNSTSSVTSQRNVNFEMYILRQMKNFQIAISWKIFIVDIRSFCLKGKTNMEKLLETVKLCQKLWDNPLRKDSLSAFIIGPTCFIKENHKRNMLQNFKILITKDWNKTKSNLSVFAQVFYGVLCKYLYIFHQWSEFFST